MTADGKQLHVAETFESVFEHLGWSEVRSWLQQNEMAFLFERSARFDADGLEPRRALVSIPTVSLTKNAATECLQICRAMRMPEHFYEVVSRMMSAAVFVHFGFEAAQDLRIGKFYLQKAVSENSNQGLEFLGFKWPIQCAAKCVVTRYHRRTVERIESLIPLLLQPLPASHAGILEPLYERVLNSFAAAMPDEDPLSRVRLLEVTEEGSNRRSWDLNVYDLEQNVSCLADLLPDCLRALGFPSQGLQSWLKYSKDTTLGHLAAGMSRSQQPFLTIYHQSAVGDVSVF